MLVTLELLFPLAKFVFLLGFLLGVFLSSAVGDRVEDPEGQELVVLEDGIPHHSPVDDEDGLSDLTLPEDPHLGTEG